VYSRCASGSSCGAGEYFVVLAIVIWNRDERERLFAYSNRSAGVGSAPLEVQEEKENALDSERWVGDDDQWVEHVDLRWGLKRRASSNKTAAWNFRFGTGLGSPP